MIKKHPYRAAVKHIRKMHHAINWTPHANNENLVCVVCQVPYPCKTIQVIDDDLYDDGEENDLPN
jgi:hypothetical protein